MRILGIETSCDDTGIAIYDDEYGVLSNKISNQTNIHSIYGGIVPELASREHVRNIIPLVRSVLKDSNTKPSNIDAIAYTAGPGLVRSLLVGATVGHSLAFAWNKMIIPINHIEGHILSPMLENDFPEFPLIALLISGGHTQLIHIAGFGKYSILGQSVDDAVGEVFDKIANLLGLGYPGSAKLSDIAKLGDPNRFIFPRPMINNPGFNFSFSGLKTFTINLIRKSDISDIQIKFDIARAFEDSVIDTLAIKCKRVMNYTGINKLLVVGGVSANSTLRTNLKSIIEKVNGNIFFAKSEFCTDNGAMIAYVGATKLHTKFKKSFKHIVLPRWPISELDNI